MAKFNIYDIARRLGHVGLPYPLMKRFSGLKPLSTFKKTVKSIFSINEFQGEDFFSVKIDGWQIPDEPSISISGGKHLVITRLNRGEKYANVIEEINLSNDKITIRGILYGEGDQYPLELITKLKKILKAKGSHSIECTRTKVEGISEIVFQKWHLPDKEGTPNEQPYLIEAISDTSVLEDLNKNE